MRVWCYSLFGLLLLTLFPAETWGDIESSQPTVHIGIASADGHTQESFFELIEGKELSLFTRKPAEEPRAFLIKLAKRTSAADALHQKFGFQLSSKLPKYALWANISPDQQMALLSYEFSGTGSSDTASIVRLPSTHVIELKTEGILCDSIWLPDSKTLVMLEATSRLKLTPKALLFALMSHPIWIMKYSVRIVALETLKQSRIEIPGEFENPTDSLWLE